MTGAASLGWRQCWAIARRDLSWRIRGLRLLFVCLFLGVGTLAAIGSLAAGIGGEIAARGSTLLGGDIEVAISQREAGPDERAALAPLGRLSATVRMRAMAQSTATGGGAPAAVLSEIKGVDGAYPLYGQLRLASGQLHRPLAADDVVIGPALAQRLRLGVGDRVRFGSALYTVRGVIADEPDRLGEGFTLGPVALTSIDGVRRTGLIQPGSFFTSKYRVRLPAGSDARAVRDRLNRQFSALGWQVKDRDGASPGASRFIERMGQFLSLIGLTALVIAGIGVSNGVSSYLGGKRGAIATLKVLGAQSGDILRLYLLQIGSVALVAIMAGLVAGIVVPPLLGAGLGSVLPVPPGVGIYPLPLATAAIYGILIALLFTLPPLARARTQPAAALFRSVVESGPRIAPRTWVSVGIAAGGVILLALVTAREPLFSAAVLASVAAVLALLLAIGWGIRQLASRLPRPRRPLLRLALANLHRPGSQTPALVIALGLALTLFVTLAAIQTSLNAEIRRTVPARAPTLFVLDIPVAEQFRLGLLALDYAPGAAVDIVPALRGTITAFGATRVADLPDIPENAWFLRGERGVTYSAVLPQGSELTAGRWWPRDYHGPPLVSLDADAARTMGVGIGDHLTVSVLGREIDARITSLRKVHWDTLGFNYIMVFTPATFEQAPHNVAASITTQPRYEAAVSAALLRAYPAITIISVGEVLGQVTRLLDQMAGAILAAAAITILAGIAVLVGAIAAARQSRAYDAVILKTLGATRWQILAAQALEYALLASLLALVALALGGTAAWFVITQVFHFGWAPDWAVVGGTLAGGATLTLVIGLAGSIPLMAVRPARALRTL